MEQKKEFKPITGRSYSLRDTDKSALFAIVQAAVNVELFTIPLYMASLYSLQGTHQITGKNNDFYLGRRWPGMATAAKAETANQHAFNGIFSVFIAEMLHLQLASNICKAVGVAPTFTSSAMQTEDFGWTCYGPDNTVIPHILDLRDTTQYKDIKVNIGPVNEAQLALFLAIEETEEKAESLITDKKRYFPVIPFEDWQPEYTEADLPLFGSIGEMYLDMFKYLTITYDDENETTLWEYVFQKKSLQRDVFNVTDAPYHYPEYPEMRATIDKDKQDDALWEVVDMIRGITDQGEGKGVIPEVSVLANLLIKNPAKKKKNLLMAVKKNYQPDADALQKDYPTYDEKGALMEGKSRDAGARVEYGKMDHYETFDKVLQILLAGKDKPDGDIDKIVTWEDWHAKGNKWEAIMLEPDPSVKNNYPIPAAEDIAGALNRLKKNDSENNFKMLSQVVAGAIKGVTSVLNDYWNGKTSTFPFPSMSGSGDRMSLCWAIFGKAPDLSIGVTPKTPGTLYHACQGLNLDANVTDDPNNCAAVQVFHTCKGSNTCAAEGGCGFVQNVNGGGSCGGSSPAPKTGSKPVSHSQGCGAGGRPSACGAQVQEPVHCGSKANMLALRSTVPGEVLKDEAASHSIQADAQGKSNAKNSGGVTPKPKPKGPVYYSAPSDNSCATNGGCAVPISASQLFPAPPDSKTNEGKMELFNFVGTNFKSTSINTMGYKTGELVYDVAWNAYIAVLQARNRPIPAKPKPSDIRLAFPPST